MPVKLGVVFFSIVAFMDASLPQFFLFGVLKAGTTAIQHYFENHKEVFLPEVKETLFFAHQPGWEALAGPGQLHPVTRLAEYKACFASAKTGQLRGEICPVYMAYPNTTLARMRSVYGDALSEVKGLLVLRHPVERAYSHYLMNVKNLQETLSFAEAIQEETRRNRHVMGWSPFFDYVFPGFYADAVRKFLAAVPQCRIWLYEDFKARPLEVLREMENFLEIAPLGRLPERRNVSGAPKNRRWQTFLVRPNGLKNMLKPVLPRPLRVRIKEYALNRNLSTTPLAPALYQDLLDHYREDIHALNGLIEADVSHWLSDARAETSVTPTF